ncbi:Ankyrin repeat domain containing protein [Pandoravirus quercus]|uniref:DNA-directed RNA polymerase n=2 Tax=Pandoravirus TaxID=2060084 RepID=A0A2U7U8M0_9VIRU|nr:Ankyrin repeat domain containing protein [Pandoravirus quercus]AVK74776.1 Ankyrin repeat domain containing protein [Pandoravirus quercus]QBZ80952.1 ankyrin repeat domain containing protein [Pandoravirus celtis]
MEWPQACLTSLYDLPPEIINGITSLLGNTDFCACIAASRLWRAHSPADYARRIVISRSWSGPSDLLDAGNATAIRGLVALGRLDLGDYTEAPCLAAYRGHLGLLVALHEMGAPGFDQGVMDCAADGGHLDVIVFLHHHRREGCTTYAMNRAAARGHLAIVDFLHRHRTEGCTRRAMDYAAANGHLDVLIYLHERRTEGCSVGGVNRAAANGHLDVVAYLLRNRREGSTAVALAAAAANGDVAMLRALTDECPVRQPGDHRAMDAAAAKGHLGAVVYLDEKRTEGCTWRAIADAAEARHFDVVLFLLDHQSAHCAEGLQRAADAALAHGRIEVAQRITAQMQVPYVPSEAAFVGAARGRHIDVLRMLAKVYPTLFERHADDMIYAAVAGGCVDAYSFCVETASLTAPADPASIERRERHTIDGAILAIAAGHTAMVAHIGWVLHAATESRVCEALTAAAATGNLATIKLVMRHKSCRTDTRARMAGAAAAAGHIDIVAWCMDKPTDYMSLIDVIVASIRSAAGAGRDDVLDWLARRTGVDPHVWQRAHPMGAALAGGHVSTLRLLRDPAFGQRTGYHSCRHPPPGYVDIPGSETARNAVGGPPDPWVDAWGQAARAGHLAAMRYIYAEGVRPGMCPMIMYEAIQGGHLGIVKFVYRTIPERDPHLAIKEANRHQQHAIVAWLTEAIRHDAYRPPAPPSPFAWMSTRHGQKGTVGSVRSAEDMPWWPRGGATPDIAINPAVSVSMAPVDGNADPSGTVGHDTPGRMDEVD